MRDPLNIKQVECDLNEHTVIVFNELPEYDLEDYDLNIPKDFKKFVADVKSDARSSFEYRQYMNFIKEYLDMNKCSFYQNVDGSSSRRIKIEIHHDPFTIEDIIRIIIKKRAFYCENMDVAMISKEAVYLHYCLLVGLIPLSTTVHELVGNGYLFVPTTHIMGKYREFVDMYHDFIDPEQLSILDRIEQATLEYDDSKQRNILAKNYIYIDMDGQYDLPPYEYIIDLMRRRIDEITNNSQESQPAEKKLIKPLIKYDENPSNALKIF